MHLHAYPIYAYPYIAFCPLSYALITLFHSLSYPTLYHYPYLILSHTHTSLYVYCLHTSYYTLHY